MNLVQKYLMEIYKFRPYDEIKKLVKLVLVKSVTLSVRQHLEQASFGEGWGEVDGRLITV